MGSQDPGKIKYLNNGTDFTSTIHHDTYPTISPTNFDLSGKFALITGASKGVGRATALSYARAGVSGLALGARTDFSIIAQEIQAAAKDAGHPEPKILTLHLDVANRSSVEEAAKTVSEAFNQRLDILVNNAGFLSTFTSLADTDPDEWWTDWEVNIRGTYLMTRSFLPLLLSSPTKIIINSASIGAHLPTPGASSYSTTKLAILRLTEFLMVDYADQGLLAFAVHPGGVKTDLACKMPGEYVERLVDEVWLSADFMTWLVHERREWLAGRYLSCNWDVTELEGRKEEVLSGDLLRVRMAVNAFPQEGV